MLVYQRVPRCEKIDVVLYALLYLLLHVSNPSTYELLRNLDTGVCLRIG